MNEQVEIWVNRIQSVSEQVEQAFGDLSPQVLNTQPASGQWSIAQVLDHLMVTNLTYPPILRQLREGTLQLPFMARIGWLTRWLGNFILKSTLPEQTRKIKTFPIWEPSESDLPADMIQQFLQHQRELVQMFREHAHLIGENHKIPSPANPNLAYPLDTAFEILVSHEERHLLQALRVKETLKEKAII